MVNQIDLCHLIGHNSDCLNPLKVTVVSDWFPRSVFGRCRALCMYLRMMLAALYLCFFSPNRNLIDVVFVDQVSHCVPILKFCSKFKVLFYCHYPDQLLSKPGGRLK